MCSQNVELGFVEKIDSWRLSSHFFPSKVGGKPAWLALKGLPVSERTSCPLCGEPCVFLLQIYCPISGDGRCFHRAFFVFCCKNAACHTKANSDKVPFLVFRNQLPRSNEFYSSEPPDEGQMPDGSEPRLETFGTCVCEVCHCLATKKCSKCKVTSYCSRSHQVINWKQGHRETCGTIGGTGSHKPNAPTMVLFPEFEVVMETEEQEIKPVLTKPEDKLLNEYSQQMANDEGKKTAALTFDEKELEGMAYGEEDKQFRKFKEKTEMEPEQVLRYQRGGQPLWVSSEGQPKESDIPKCHCGANRQFEFQILPQLLVYMNVDSIQDSIDWGTLLIYTCSNSCDEGLAYKSEFLWRQNYSNTSLPKAT
ncbi:programmed cell death protein 2-like [Anneissia japonica]|uniref:programmed cell death protein 2-like n=1 Tax=Anneissia japonica TaxID=1529436 RepID=UPI001425B71C|nr:programmed cell death protein 2-like [Anneissia japonica]